MGKIITIIIIGMAVWSTIAGMIEKHKKEKMAASKGVKPNAFRQGVKPNASRQPELQTLRVSTRPQAPAPDPLEARIDALRRRPALKQILTSSQKPTKKRRPVVDKAIESESDFISHIAPLHVEDCPLPPTRSKKRERTRVNAVSRLLKSPRSIRTAIILTEVLGKPLSQR